MKIKIGERVTSNQARDGGVIVDITLGSTPLYTMADRDSRKHLNLYDAQEHEIEVVPRTLLSEQDIEVDRKLVERYRRLKEREEEEEEPHTKEDEYRIQVTIKEPEPLPIPVEVGQVRQGKSGTVVLIITNRYRPSMYAKGGEDGVREEMKALILYDGEVVNSMEMKTMPESSHHVVQIEHQYPILLKSELIIQE